MSPRLATTLPRLALTALISTILLSGSEARAESTHDTKVEEHHYIMGANALMLGAIAHGRMVGEFGPGGFFGIVAIPHWLEIELTAHYLRKAGNISEVPVDLVLKKPFHPLRWLNPYVGLGPSVTPSFAPGESTVHVGLATEVGSYFWLTPHVGLSAEVDYNLVADHGLLQEVAGVSGVVFGW